MSHINILGTLPALLVVIASMLDGASLVLTGGLALGAVVLGTVLHQSVLLDGVVLIYGRERLAGRSSVGA